MNEVAPDLESRFPALRQLSGAYLGQHWDYTYGTPEGAVHEFCAHHADDHEALAAVVAGLDAVFRECPDERARLDALTPMGFCYWPGDGKLDEFLSWTRSVVLDVMAGGKVPAVLPPRPAQLESPEMFLLAFPWMQQVGETYFGEDSFFPCAADAIDAYERASDPNDSALVFAALNLLDREAESEDQMRSLLGGAGWQKLPPPGELAAFVRYAVNLFAYEASKRWHAERGLPFTD